MSTHNGQKDPEDMFSETRMSFGDHLEELRIHLWRALAGFGVACVFAFFIGNAVLQFIAMPVEVALGKFYEKRVAEEVRKLNEDRTAELLPSDFFKMVFIREQFRPNLGEVDQEILQNSRPIYKLDEQGQIVRDSRGYPIVLLPNYKRDENGKLVNDANGQPIILPEGGRELEPVLVWMSYDEPIRAAAALAAAQKIVGRRPVLTTLSIQEGVVVYIKVCVVCGIVIGSPWIFWQIWSFIAAGLYAHEKKLVHYYLPISLFLFLAGVAVCQFAVMPKAVEALLWFNEWLNLEPDLRLNEWLGFAIWMPVVFGLSFQTPLLMLFLERVGILTVEIYRKQRRICYFVMAVFAALITPSIDPVSMLLMWVPMCLLFELGIWLCLLQPKAPDLDIDVPESGEQIEV